ncbi:MAG: TatD family hydrolase [Candidatus Zambryskibacteria bacterium]|nr:TatD family hydrolase [Candidatus Zambryskibacteria bacterium]
MFEYFDIHSHLCFPDYDSDREEQIEEMKKNKIATISVGVDFESSKKEVALAEKHKNIFACVGQHPEDQNNDFNERLIELANNPKVVAIGECGLDYKAKPTKEIQVKMFESQINLAIGIGKPLMIHVRSTDKIEYDAYKDTLNILENYAKKFGDKLSGNMHFFVGNTEILKRILNIGFTVSFAGVITFTNEYDECVKYVPSDMIMSETDSPFVAPIPYRGKRNSPLYVVEVVKKIAEIRNEPFDKIKTALQTNALRHFPLISTIAS